MEEAPGVRVSTLLDAGRAGGPELEISVLGVKAQPGRTDLFLETSESLDAGRPRMKALADGVIFHVPMKPRVADRPLPARVAVAWTASRHDEAKWDKSLSAVARATSSSPTVVRIASWARKPGMLNSITGMIASSRMMAMADDVPLLWLRNFSL